jgi:hypothetical protein
MKKYYTPLLIVLLFIACNNKKNNPPLSHVDSITLRIIDENPGLSEGQLERKVLEELLSASPGAFEKIQEGERLIGEFSSYMDTVTVAFTMYCGMESGAMKKEAEQNAALTDQFFIEQGYGKQLEQRLLHVTDRLKDILLTDSSRRLVETIAGVPPTIKGKPPYHDFDQAWFAGVTPVNALSVLKKIEKEVNDIRSIIFKEYTNTVSSHP